MKNRWLIAAAAVGIHISIGSVYAWSVATKPLMSQFGWSLKEVTTTFSIAIFFLGTSAAFFGHFVEREGPRKAGSLASLFFGIGVAGAGFALKLKSLYLLYLTYGVLGGMGLGIGYISPVSTLVKWFPDRRGLATGLAIMGFGFAALISGPVMARLINAVGLMNMFFILGCVYFVVMFSSAQYLAPPPEGWMPEGYKSQLNSGKKKLKVDLAQLTANEAAKTIRFYFLWIMVFINITCGIAVISVASPMAQEIAGLTPLAAATMVGLIGLFNGLGRIGWASFSDYIGRPNTYMTFFVIQVIAYFSIPRMARVLTPHTNAIFFQAVIFLILTCYGGGFASIPAFIGDIFGTKQVSAIHGYILTAWAAAGIAGPMFVSWVREITNSYTKTPYVFVCLFVVAFVVSLLMKVNIRKLQAKHSTSPAAG